MGHNFLDNSCGMIFKKYVYMISLTKTSRQVHRLRDDMPKPCYEVAEKATKCTETGKWNNWTTVRTQN